MKKKKPDDLIKGLINNDITRIELDKLLEDLEEESALRDYSKYLEKHYTHIINEYINQKKK